MTVPTLPDELIRDIMYKYKGMQHPLVSVIAPFHAGVQASLRDNWIDYDELSFDEFESIYVISIAKYHYDDPHKYPLPLTDLSKMEIRYAGLGFGEFDPYELSNIDDLDDDCIVDIVRNFKYYRFDVTGIPKTKRSETRLGEYMEHGWGQEISLYQDSYWYVLHDDDLVTSSDEAEAKLSEHIHSIINRQY